MYQGLGLSIRSSRPIHERVCMSENEFEDYDGFLQDKLRYEREDIPSLQQELRECKAEATTSGDRVERKQNILYILESH